MASTNMVTASNVNYLKVHILNMVDISNYLISSDQMMGMFEYETEEIETIVSSYILTECQLMNDKLILSMND